MYVMRTRIVFVLLLLLPAVLKAQESSRDPRAGEKIRAAHTAYITQRLALTADEAERFWPVYREYNEKRKALRQEMRAGRRSEASDEERIARDLELKQEELDIEKKYTARLGEVIPAEKLVRLPDAEAGFRRLILRQIQEQRRRGR